MKIKKYPDGTSYIVADDRNDSDWGGVEYVFKINNYEDLWHLNQWVDAWSQVNWDKPCIVIPNLIDAQADRRFEKNQSFGLKLVCQFLNNLNAHFKIFHPHNPEVVEALIDNVEIIDNSKFINTILNDYFHRDSTSHPTNLKYLDNELILMSSDAGGFKPLMKLCDKIDWKGGIYSASKARNPQSGQLTQLVDRKDFEEKDILIVDDICVYGGTFKGLSKLLRERNCGKLYLAVSHMTVQNLGEDPITNYFDKVFTTNSKFDNYYYNKQSNYVSYDREGNEEVNFDKINPKNLKIIKLF